MKMLLLGGSGQIGWELQRSLVPLGELVVAPRDQAELTDPDRLVHMVEQHAPDVIVNAAAFTAVDRAEAEPMLADAVNHQAVDILARLTARSGGWLVQYSTDYVFDGHGGTPFTEQDATAPLNAYGASKLAGERAITASGCRHLIVRTSWVHAPRGHNFIRTILRLARERDSLCVVADQHGAPTSAEHVADLTAHMLSHALANADVSGTYHLAATGSTNWCQLAQLVVAEARRHHPDLKLAPESITAVDTMHNPGSAVRPLNSRLDTTKLRSTFGLSLPSWQQGVERTLAELVLS